MSWNKGPIGWMGRNSVTANLMMLIALVGGLWAARNVKQEVFPDFELNAINISIPYPGASPDDVEQSVVLVVEEAVRSIEGVKRTRSVAAEGFANVTLELMLDADQDKVSADVKSAVDRIVTFPALAERPTVAIASQRREVVSLFLSGDQDVAALQELAERARFELLALPEISQIEIQGVRPLELRIEVSRENLETYGLTLNQIAAQIRSSSVELPGGGLKTRAGELLVRVDDRRRGVASFSEIIIGSNAAGNQLRLGDIATLTDGYEQTDTSAYFNGKPLVWVTAYRVGDETPTSVSKAMRAYADRLRPELPAGVDVTIWNDESELLAARIDLLRRNALTGLVLVLITLALFLHRRLALWVALGIPVSFLGAFIFMNAMNVSINMISLFALIVTLGMVVDDAIIVAESIHTKRLQGLPPLRAAIEGARMMVVPVTFSILTTIAAFSPLLVVPGFMGKMMSIIPLVVISVLTVSLLESFFILPAHLSHSTEEKPGLWSTLLRPVDRLQATVNQGLQKFINQIYQPILRKSLRYRYSVVAAGIASLLVCGAFVRSGRVPFSFFPKLEGDVIAAGARLPYGSPLAQTEAIGDILNEAVDRAANKFGGRQVVRGVFAKVGEAPPGSGGVTRGSHVLTVWLALVPSEERDFSSEEFAQAWRDEVPALSGVETLTIGAVGGPGGGKPVAIQLSHQQASVLAEASEALAKELEEYPSLTGIENSFSGGKPQLNFKLRDEASTLGLTSRDVANAMRSSFFGAEALREQRGRHELKVRVKLPENQRSSEEDLNDLTVATPAGGYVPLAYVADFTRGSAPTSINREGGRRTVNVSADLALGTKSPRPVLDSLRDQVLPKLRARFAGLNTQLVGQQREQNETFASLGDNSLIALLVIFVLLAIPFKSYLQPIIVMSAIPFGLLGAVLGHALLGYGLSMISMLGMVALSGVVVNDSLVLVDGINRFRRQGEAEDNEPPQPMPLLAAIAMGSTRRFRPILLTSLTTFFGLMPMIFETSLQARFLIPMAISLGFGALFVTVIALLLVPSLYLIVEDLAGIGRWLVEPERGYSRDPGEKAAGS